MESYIQALLKNISYYLFVVVIKTNFRNIVDEEAVCTLTIETFFLWKCHGDIISFQNGFLPAGGVRRFLHHRNLSPSSRRRLNNLVKTPPHCRTISRVTPSGPSLPASPSTTGRIGTQSRGARSDEIRLLVVLTRGGVGKP